MPVPPMQDGCPWSALSHLAPPNVKWCEAQQCSWIVEPANTWSNLVYLLLGAGLLLWAPRGNHLARLFGRALVLVGACSFAFHMSYTFAFQVLDYAGMYAFIGLPLTLGLWRLEVLPAARLWPTYVALVSGLTLVTIPLGLAHLPIQLVIGGLVFAILGTELALRGREVADRRYLVAAVALLAAASVASALDLTRALCDPEDHLLQGHAVWHVLSALALLSSWRFYSQFEGRLAGELDALRRA